MAHPNFPIDAFCIVENCGHKNASHTHDPHAVSDSYCGECRINMSRGYMVAVYHEFKPRYLAGGALTPAEEKEKYDRIMRGEL